MLIRATIVGVTDLVSQFIEVLAGGGNAANGCGQAGKSHYAGQQHTAQSAEQGVYVGCQNLAAVFGFGNDVPAGRPRDKTVTGKPGPGRRQQ